jgi:hypothetical protein
MILNYKNWSLNEDLVNNLEVYHVSSKMITDLENRPMWFALEKSHSDAWLKNTEQQHDKAFQYSAKIKGKISHITDEDVIQVFDNIGEDPEDWVTEIVGNPSGEEVMSLEGTKALIKAGYQGIIYSDYDPRNWDNDLDALIIFKPLECVHDFKL